MLKLDCKLLFTCSLSFLDENAKGMIHKKGGQWSPLISYRNGLTGQDEEEEGQPKGSRAKRKLPMEGDESKEEEGISKQNKTKAKQQKPKAPRGRPQKSTTSTAQQTVLSTAKPVRPVTPVVEEPEAGDDSNEDDDTMSSGSEEWSQEDQAPLSSMKKPNQTTDKIEDNTEEASTAEKQGAVKRKREETSQSDEDEDEDEDEEQDLDDQDFESPPASSQRSWLSSQKGRQDSKKARLSYSKKDTSGIGRTSLEDIEDEDEIEEYESEDDTDKEKTKAPVRARREKKELPDDFFGDSQEEKDTEDESSLETAF